MKITEKWIARERTYVQNHPSNTYHNVWCPTCVYRLCDSPAGTMLTCPKCRTIVYIDRHGVTQELNAEKRVRVSA